MSQISRAVRLAVKTQLQGTTINNNGINDRLVALATAYGITAYAIDWSTTSQNFIFGQIDPVQFEESSPFTYPLLTIDCLRSQNTNRIKLGLGHFSGMVTASIDVHHSWYDNAVLADFSSDVDATEDAVISCLNDPTYQTWPGNMLWTGNVALARGPIRMGGYNWLQSIRFTCTFELIAQ